MGLSLAKGMNAYLIDGKRTPLGRSHAEKGAFRSVRADELLATLFRDFETRIPVSLIDDILVGCVGQHLEQGKNIARLAALLADYPHVIPAATINRLCASSLAAFHFAATQIDADQANLCLVGGVEHMHHVPMNQALDYHPKLMEKFPFPFTQMGLTAEELAKQYGISRQAQDAFALSSHEKALRARQLGFWKREIVPVSAPEGMVDTDQGPRTDTSLEKLSALKPAFVENGTVTAGNSSPVSDGASLVCLASKDLCERENLRPRAQVIDCVVVGVDPCRMGIGPVPAIEKLLKRTGLSVQAIDVFEINEAFASQAIACQRALHIPDDKLNPWGGAISLGHPLGCTGTRLIATLLNVLETRSLEWGVASLCVGHGQGMAVLLRKV